MKTHSAPWLRHAEWLLVGFGALCAVVVLGVAGISLQYRQAPASFSLQTVKVQDSSATSIAVKPNPGGLSRATVMGRLEIPKIGISVPILSDYESASLLEGVGHVPGTAMPGGLGTLGLAGHRDTYFRPLRNIAKDMDIHVINADGVYHYRVTSTEIVTPENVQVLDIRSRPELTLITCYPFYYIGAAPKRFIVHAYLVSALPDAK